jgi:hypothetical protein
MKAETKLCRKCGTIKPVEAFHLRRSNAGTPYRRGECRPCRNADDMTRYYAVYRHDPAHRERMRVTGLKHYYARQAYWQERHRANDRNMREETLAHYGGRCACCGEGAYEFLAIDHEAGGGNVHRKANKIFSLHRWLKRNGFPPGFRVLCHNCNQALSHYGFCPHQRAASALRCEAA